MVLDDPARRRIDKHFWDYAGISGIRGFEGRYGNPAGRSGAGLGSVSLRFLPFLAFAAIWMIDDYLYDQQGVRDVDA